MSLGSKTDKFACSHKRACLLFTESIKNKNGFHTKRCKNNRIFAKERKKIGDKKCLDAANQMGYFTNILEEGVFYLKTNGAPPYAGKNKLFKRIFLFFFSFYCVNTQPF